MSVLVEVTVQW